MANTTKSTQAPPTIQMPIAPQLPVAPPQPPVAQQLPVAAPQAPASHSDEQKRHIASTLRIVGIGGFVTYGWPEITTSAISKWPVSALAHFPHGGYLVLGMIIFAVAEVGAIRVLKGVN
jgi:hypothetical protein